jgi:hypothetical protein
LQKFNTAAHSTTTKIRIKALTFMHWLKLTLTTTLTHRLAFTFLRTVYMFSIFSSLDDRARPKGSRDPLGAEATWSFFGRKIVGNLTTVTANLDNFMVALLCCRYANQGATETELIQERYLRAEQVAAYLKLSVPVIKYGFLGITKASKNFANADIALGKSAKAQLLASQASYGLWGLYSSALESAELITGSNRQLSPSGDALVQIIIAKFGESHWKDFCSLADRDRLDITRTATLAPQFIAMLGDLDLRATVVDALLASQHDCELQSELYPLAQAYLQEQEISTNGVFCQWILNNANASDALKTVMQRIKSLDPLLKLADIVMLWLQGKNDESKVTIIESLQPYLQGLELSDDWEKESELPHKEFLIKLCSAAMKCDSAKVVEAILEQNKSLMLARGGAAWIEIEGKKLVVRVRNDKPQDLSKIKQLETEMDWRYTYFLSSFLSITQQRQA